jgi:hypothetical protein
MTIGFVSILLGALGGWMLGALWYSPLLFSKIWQKEVGLSDEQIKTGNMVVIFGLSYVCMVLMSVGLSFVIGAHPTINATHGFFHGAMSGLFFCAASMGINYLYGRRSIKLFLIDGIYQILLLGVSGMIMAAMA